MSKLTLVRLAVHLISSIGVSKVVNDIITNNTNVETAADMVKVWTGSIVLGSLIADHACMHVNARLNDIIAWHESRNASATIVT